MKKVTFAVLGAGNRGTRYAVMQQKYPEEMEVTAIADNRPVRLESLNKVLKLPKERLFASGEEMLEQPKLADVMVIATQDKQHCAHAIAALEKGYDLLLEKPIAVTAADCKAIAETAHKYGRRIIVCHVLRYTVFYQQIKKLIDDGVLGKVESIEAAEQVGYYHYAHSYVRGNWHNSIASSPMILAKSCHDMDLFLWLTGRSCKRVTSFGSQSYFNKEHCPPNATERCTDGCPVEDCPYHAQKFYYSRIPGWPANVLHPEPTEENILEILKTTDYGRCVFQMPDNDVVDHEVTNLLMDDGTTVTFTMTAFSNRQTRTIHVFGSKGDVVGDFKARTLSLRVFGKEEETIDLSPLYDDFTGHGGGDGRMMKDVIRFYRGDDFDTSAITMIDRSTESHYLAFAAEYSRTHDGACVDMDEFMKTI